MTHVAWTCCSTLTRSPSAWGHRRGSSDVSSRSAGLASIELAATSASPTATPRPSSRRPTWPRPLHLGAVSSILSGHRSPNDEVGRPSGGVSTSVISPRGYPDRRAACFATPVVLNRNRAISTVTPHSSAISSGPFPASAAFINKGRGSKIVPPKTVACSSSSGLQVLNSTPSI